jgi:hypothetical protein
MLLARSEGDRDMKGTREWKKGAMNEIRKETISRYISQTFPFIIQ